MKKLIPQHAPSDFLASIVVFLVALPLCMGVAIASGLPPAAGLITGMVGGILVGALSGSPLQVSGPAAGLTVLVFDIVQNHGVTMLGPVVLVAGLVQILAGLLRSGRYFQAVPPSVVAGMLAGIGMLIFASQFHVMVDASPRGSGIANLLAIPEALVSSVVGGGAPLAGLLLGAAVFLMMAVWPTVVRWAPWLKLVPSALVAVLVATAAAALLELQVPYVELPKTLAAAVGLPSAGALQRLLEPSVLGAALALAIIASAETLLCATAVDRMHSGPRTQYDRELWAQGVGNVVCGALGALPMTGVIVRSSANVEAGARSRLSSMFHGVWLLLLVGAAPSVLQMIPVSALAGLLLFTGYKLMKQDLQSMSRVSRSEVAIFGATFVAIVTTDLLKGVLLGLGLALVRLLWTVAHLRVHAVTTGPARTDVFFSGSATFLKLPELTQALAGVPRSHEVHIHLEGLDFVDHAGLEAISAWEKQHLAGGGTLSLDWNELELRARQPRARAAPTWVPPTPIHEVRADA